MRRPKVYLVPAKKPRVFRWQDRNGKWKQRVCHASNLRAAARQARDLEDELAKDWYSVGDVTWQEFCDAYLEQRLAQVRPRTAEKWLLVKRKFERFLASKGIDPGGLVLREIDFPLTLEFETWIAPTLARTTVVTDMKALRAGMSFAARNGWMAVLPRGFNIKEPARQLPAPITEEEFQRLLAAVNRVMVRRLRKAWQAILKGYWLGGFRLMEPLDFRWSGPGFHVPVLDDCQFSYIEWSARQKNKKVQAVVITDELADVFRELPQHNDFVFQVEGKARRLTSRRQVSQIIHNIAAEARLTRQTDRGQEYVTAKHLRRSFGQRLVQERGVSFATLRHMMRHSSVQTTMRYYVADDAASAARELQQTRGASHA